MEKSFRGQFEGSCNTKHLPPALTSQGLAGVTERQKTMHLCDSTVHAYRYTGFFCLFLFFVVHRDSSMTRVLLHSTQKTRALHHVNSPVSVFLQLLIFFKSTPEYAVIKQSL